MHVISLLDVTSSYVRRLPICILLPQRGNTFSMGCWHPCVSVNNLPASVESTLVYYIREFNFKKELKYSSTEDRGCYPITCHEQREASATVRYK